MSLPPATFAGSLFGPISTKSLYITGRRLTPKPSATNFSSAACVVHEHDVGIAAPRQVERLAGAERDDAHLDAGVLLERRQQVPEQAGLLGRRGRGHDDEFVLRGGRRRAEDQQAGPRTRQAVDVASQSLSFQKCRGFGRPRRNEKLARPATARPAARPAGTGCRRRGASPAPRLCVIITIVVPRA